MANFFQSRVCTLIGGSGFIGSRLALDLSAIGQTVRIFDTQVPSDTLLNVPGIEFVQGDVCDPRAVWAVTQGASIAINLAGVVGVRAAHEDATAAYETAVRGTEVLLDQFDGPTVLFSSSAVYGLNRSQAVDEQITIGLEDAKRYDSGLLGYAAGKLQMEKMGLRARSEGRYVVIVRPFNVVGAGQSGAYGMVLPTFVRQALLGQPIEIHDDGQQLRCFSDVDTFSGSLIKLLGVDQCWVDPMPIFNIGTSTSVRIIDVARKIAMLTKSQVPFKYVPYEVKYPGRLDVRSRQPDTTKVDRLIGQENWMGIDCILSELIAFERRRVGVSR